jgi:hypothetical protein
MSGDHNQYQKDKSYLDGMDRYKQVRELVKDPSLRVTEIAWKTGYNKGHVSRLRKEAMRQALETEQEPVAWQPIESVPKTGRKVILFYKNRLNVGRTVIARWLTDEQATEIDADDVGLEGGWYECIDNWDDLTEVAIHEGEPSHWMPLPAPPIEALRQALETEQEPVAWMHTTGTGHVYFRKKPQDKVFNPQPVYTVPPKREWVGLTDDDVIYFRSQATFCDEFDAAFMAELIEKDLKEKNHG